MGTGRHASTARAVALGLWAGAPAASVLFGGAADRWVFLLAAIAALVGGLLALWGSRSSGGRTCEAVALSCLSWVLGGWLFALFGPTPTALSPATSPWATQLVIALHLALGFWSARRAVTRLWLMLAALIWLGGLPPLYAGLFLVAPAVALALPLGLALSGLCALATLQAPAPPRNAPPTPRPSG